MVLVLEQPLICPLAAGADSEEKFHERLLRKHPQQLWVTEDHIPWIVQYMATEHAFQMVKEDPADPDAVAEPNIKWDWETNDGYYAIVNGKQLRCTISSFTKAKWDKVSAAHNYTTTFKHASKEALGQACRDFLELHIESLQ